MSVFTQIHDFFAAEKPSSKFSHRTQENQRAPRRSTTNPFAGICVPPARDQLNLGFHTFCPKEGNRVDPAAAQSRRVFSILGASVDGKSAAFKRAQQIAELCGQDVTLISRPENLLPQQYYNSVAGMISSQAGRGLEPIVDLVMEQIKKAVKEGKNLKFCLHSQGAIILANALDQLRSEVGQEYWQKEILPRLETVTVLGSPVHNWPRDVRVEYLEFSGDYVARGSRAAGSLRGFRQETSSALASIVGRLPGLGALYEHGRKPVPKDNEQIIRLERKGIDAHFMDTYLDNYVSFVVEKYKDQPAVFYNSIIDGHYSPQVVRAVHARLKAMEQKPKRHWLFG